MTGIAALAAMPALAAPKPASLRKPARLRAGDTVGLVEPAGFTADSFDLALVMETVRAMGLVPKPAPHLLSRYGYLAGEDKVRAADLNAMFADDSVRAIFAVRGGWGCARILPYLDFAAIRANPKLLIGFSDITALHLAIAAKA
ncbi:MAG: LD-carboxypeptidase, partial [Sphingomonadaceae bacterium]|nr:LD-carboxypeptidase [Sphingomonadaceae bacterium]